MTDFENKLASALSTYAFGRAHRHLEETGSTNDDAARWLAQGAPHGALVTSDRQKQGRGRLGRTWDSTEALDIYASLILRPLAGQTQLGALGLAVALGILDGLRSCTRDVDLPLTLKWPNDILIGSSKVAGILCEARWQGSQASIVCGFGINVGRTHFEDELKSTATSLQLAYGAQIRDIPTRHVLLAAVLLGLESRISAFLERGFLAIRTDYEANCRELGRRVTLSIPGPDGAPAGTSYDVAGLDLDGALLVRRAKGTRSFRVQSADVWLSPEHAPRS